MVIDLTGLDIGASIHLSQVQLPAGVSAVSHEKDATVATIAAPTVAPAAETEAEAGGGTAA